MDASIVTVRLKCWLSRSVYLLGTEAKGAKKEAQRDKNNPNNAQSK